MTTLQKPKELDELYPYSSTNNSRSIVLEALKRFKECPCSYHKVELESYGFTVDYDDADWGTGREELTNN